MDANDLKIGKIVSMPFGQNTYVAHLEGRSDCVVFDPGLQPEAIFSYLDSHRLTPTTILCTHGHSDHIGGNRAMKDRWPEAPLVIGAGDASKLTDPAGNLSADFGVALVSPPADQTVVEGDRVEGAGLAFEVLDTPGHSAGHVVFLCKHSSPWHVFGGDVLFEGSIGRTDFPDGDFEALKRSIHEKLFTLPDDTIVLPGHGGTTTVGLEKRGNPWVALQ